MTRNSSDINVLNSLIATTRDSIEGYRDAAEQANNDQYASMFRHFAEQRQRVVGELENTVRQAGGDPEDSGTFSGAAHRTWLDLRNAVTGTDDKAVIAEVERGEDHLKEKYEEAMERTDLSPQASQTIASCYQSVREGHDRVRDLKHSLNA